MSTRDHAAMPAAPTAELLVHSDGAGDRGITGRALQRWRARHASPERADAPGGLTLQVDDLQGRRLAEVSDAGPLTRICLPPGTCIVTAIGHGVRRGYTLTLEPGRPFHLHLNHWPAWP